MKKLILLIFIIFFTITGYSQETNDSINKAKALLKSIEPYGTFQYALGGSRRGWAVVDIIPRVGIKGEWKFDNNPDYAFFTKAEVGLHLTRRNDYITISSDPGAPAARSEDALFARLGYIGISTPYGSISIGKQWGVHYTLGGYIDNMYMFGGDGIGVYNAGTDGGSSGTGRADQAIKYELNKGNFYLGLQVQSRNISGNSRYGVDALGYAASYKINRFIIGTSYYQVMDGVENPTTGEAKIDDNMGSIFLDYHYKEFEFAIMAMTFNNHEKDNTGVYYKGWGVEYHMKYNFGKNKNWSVVHNSSIIMPEKNLNSKYIMNRYSLEVARRFSQNTLIVVGARFDNSVFVNGHHEELLTLAFGFYYNFNYPVP